MNNCENCVKRIGCVHKPMPGNSTCWMPSVEFIKSGSTILPYFCRNCIICAEKNKRIENLYFANDDKENEIENLKEMLAKKEQRTLLCMKIIDQNQATITELRGIIAKITEALK